MTTVRYSLPEALSQAVAKTWDNSLMSLRMFWKMLTGDLSMKNLSGPVTIADYAGQAARLGLGPFIEFLAWVSISLGVLNLLPIPLLDGGHLLYYTAEIIKGSPVSERTMQIGQHAGMVLLLGLMLFAFYNDLNRLFVG
jgi:regulator of sigma E protease